jgi:hypothetical protein
MTYRPGVVDTEFPYLVQALNTQLEHVRELIDHSESAARIAYLRAVAIRNELIDHDDRG